MITRRQILMQTLFGAGAYGLRALATGLPAAFFVNPQRAFATGVCTGASSAQYVIFNTSAGGDPINANAPGTYAFPDIVHNTTDPALAGAQVTMNGKSYLMASYWSTLPQAVRDRMVFWHLMTNTPVHPKEPDVLRLMGAAPDREMLPSIIARSTASCLSTVQKQPLSVGGSGPSEALAYSGSVMPIIPPTALKNTLGNVGGPLFDGTLQMHRDVAMKQVYAFYKTAGTPAQKAFIDATVSTQDQVRSLNASLLGTLASITDNSPASQILAAVTLIKMNVAPVIAIHIPFGGDNHSDAGLTTEASETKSGIDSIAYLMSQLQSAGLQDRVSFVSLNVFGRTLATNGGRSATTGRTHNPNHQVSITIGQPFKGGVIGDIVKVGNDYGATGIDSVTGLGTASGDVAATDTLGAFAKSVLAGVGGDPNAVSRGKVITAGLV